MIRIINTYQQIRELFADGIFDLGKWETYAKKISAELVRKCEEDSSEYDFEETVFPVLNVALQSKDKMGLVNDSFVSVSKTLKENMSILFDTDIDLDIILYLGLCNGAGWATTLNNRNAILLGAEKIIELNWCDIASMQGLILHEVGHIWHKTYGKLYLTAASQKEKSIWQLYQEGVATVCAQILLKNPVFFNQDRNGWLSWCQNNEKEIKSEYLSRINNSQNIQDFFGDWCSYKGYSDVGYYLGCQFVKYLQTEYTLIEIANLSCDALLNKFEEYAQQVEILDK